MPPVFSRSSIGVHPAVIPAGHRRLMTPAWFGRAGLAMILAALIFGAGSTGPFSSVPFGVGMALIVCAAHEVLVLRAIRR